MNAKRYTFHLEHMLHNCHIILFDKDLKNDLEGSTILSSNRIHLSPVVATIEIKLKKLKQSSSIDGTKEQYYKFTIMMDIHHYMYQSMHHYSSTNTYKTNDEHNSYKSRETACIAPLKILPTVWSKLTYSSL